MITPSISQTSLCPEYCPFRLSGYVVIIDFFFSAFILTGSVVEGGREFCFLPSGQPQSSSLNGGVGFF